MPSHTIPAQNVLVVRALVRPGRHKEVLTHRDTVVESPVGQERKRIAKEGRRDVAECGTVPHVDSVTNREYQLIVEYLHEAEVIGAGLSAEVKHAPS